MMMSEIEGSKEKWMKHYSSGHNILLVGEGDFSFSLCLGMTFGSANNIVATSLDSYVELIKKYKNAKANLLILKALGASLLHGVDATQMRTLADLQLRKFHRIIYNFPHAGFHGKEDNPDMIMMHRNLVRGFLWNASRMLCRDGEIHISHKITAPFDSWRIEDLALECSLLCVGQDEFKIEDYPWYHNKRGSGSRSDEPFPLGACRTFKFKVCPGTEEILKLRRNLDLIPSTPQIFATPVGLQQHTPASPFTSQMFPIPPVGMQQYTPISPFTPQMFPTSPVGMQLQTPVSPFAHQMFPTPPFGMQQPPPVSPLTFNDVDLSLNGLALHDYASECHRIFGWFLNHVEETFGCTSYDVHHSVHEALRIGFEMYMGGAAPGRPLNGFIGILEELRQLSILRSERLRQML